MDKRVVNKWPEMNSFRFTLSKYFMGLFLVIFLSFSNGTNQEKKEIPKIIFDTDMGSDCDDVGALALLHVYTDQGKAEILATIFSSGKVPYGAGVIDAINTYFGRGDIPIGADHETDIGDPKDKMRAEMLAKDTARFKHNLIHSSQAIEQTKLNRKILSEQEDNSIIYLTVGHTNGLYELLISEPDEISPFNGKELITKKVKHWVAMGALNANNTEGKYTRDWNFYRNGTALSTEYLVKNFPKPIYFIATGSDVMTGKSLLKTPENNIIRNAYQAWLKETLNKELADQRPSWDIIAAYFAIEGKGDFLFEEESGFLDFDAEKGALWIRKKNAQNHHFILIKPHKKEALEDFLNKIIATNPLH